MRIPKAFSVLRAGAEGAGTAGRVTYTLPACGETLPPPSPYPLSRTVPKFKKSFKRAGFNQKLAVCGLVAGVTLLFSCGEPAGADTEVVAVQGDVRSGLTGRPLSRAVVVLMQQGEPVAAALTSGDGAYSFTGIEANTGYTVSVNAVTGYLDQETDTFTVSGITNVPIMLDRNWPSTGAVVAAAVSADGIAAAPDGTIYFTHSSGNKIRYIAPDGTGTEDYAGTGDAGVNDDSRTAATFNGPHGITVSADGTRVYVTDSGGHRVRHITDDEVLTIAGCGRDGDFWGDGDDAKLAQLNNPEDVAVDAAGNVYIADRVNERVRKISALDGKISTIAGGGSGPAGQAVSVSLDSLWGIAVDIQGNVYITESNRVCKITSAGAISTVIGTAESGNDMTHLNSPKGIAVDAAGTVYVADSNNNRVVKVPVDGIPSVLAGDEHFDSPTRLAIGPDGALYIVDSGNSRIMKY